MSGQAKYPWAPMSVAMTVPLNDYHVALLCRAVEREEQRMRDLLNMTLEEYVRKYPSEIDNEWSE